MVYCECGSVICFSADVLVIYEDSLRSSVCVFKIVGIYDCSLQMNLFILDICISRIRPAILMLSQC